MNPFSLEQRQASAPLLAAVGRAASLRLSLQCNTKALQHHSPPAMWCLWVGGCLLGQPR